jgi:hypothetical protein
LAQMVNIFPPGDLGAEDRPIVLLTSLDMHR